MSMSFASLFVTLKTKPALRLVSSSSLRLVDHPGEAALATARKRLEAAERACQATVLAGPHRTPRYFRTVLLNREVAAANVRRAYFDMLNIPPAPPTAAKGL